jgi:hypothetical protein
MAQCCQAQWELERLRVSLLILGAAFLARNLELAGEGMPQNFSGCSEAI